MYRAENPTESMNILNDDDVAFFLCETNALPIQQRTTLAITISQISMDAPTTQKKNNVVVTHEDVDIVGDDCTYTEEDDHANTMGDDFANLNVNPLASDPELRQVDNVPMSNPVLRVVNSIVPSSSKTSHVVVDGNVDIAIGGSRVLEQQPPLQPRRTITSNCSKCIHRFSSLSFGAHATVVTLLS
ncbi:hypothetical protein Q3G72_032640 [Acer saccharum]|nr:hypothetical protein Q3G72_032640 [Acer saccharum]